MKGVVICILGVLFCAAGLMISRANLVLAFVLGGLGILITVAGWFIKD